MVWRVGKVLRLQAKCESWFVDNAALTGNRSIKMVPGVKLNPGLSGEHSQHASRSWLINLCRLCQLAFRMVQYEVVVVSHAQPQLFVIGIDPLAYGMWRSKIEWRALHGFQFSGGNKGRIYRREPRRIDLHHMPQNFTLSLASEIEIGMVGQVQDGIFVGVAE